MAWQIVVLKTTSGPAWIREPTEEDVISLGSVSEIKEIVDGSFDATAWLNERHGHYIATDESFSIEFKIHSRNETQSMMLNVRGGLQSLSTIVDFAKKNDLQLCDCSATWINLDHPSDEGWRGYDSLRRSALNQRSE